MYPIYDITDASGRMLRPEVLIVCEVGSWILGHDL